MLIRPKPDLSLLQRFTNSSAVPTFRASFQLLHGTSLIVIPIWKPGAVGLTYDLLVYLVYLLFKVWWSRKLRLHSRQEGCSRIFLLRTCYIYTSFQMFIPWQVHAWCVARRFLLSGQRGWKRCELQQNLHLQLMFKGWTLCGYWRFMWTGQPNQDMALTHITITLRRRKRKNKLHTSIYIYIHTYIQYYTV